MPFACMCVNNEQAQIYESKSKVVIMDPSTFCYTFTTSSSCLWVAMCHFWHLLLAFTGSLPLPFSEYVDAQTRAIQWLTISSWSWSVHCATIHLVQIMEIASMLLFHWQPSEFQFLPSRTIAASCKFCSWHSELL